MANPSPAKRGRSRLARILANRDQEILGMAKRGLRQREIAARLGLSSTAVCKTLQRLRALETQSDA